MNTDNDSTISYEYDDILDITNQDSSELDESFPIDTPQIINIECTPLYTVNTHQNYIPPVNNVCNIQCIACTPNMCTIYNECTFSYIKMTFIEYMDKTIVLSLSGILLSSKYIDLYLKSIYNLFPFTGINIYILKSILVTTLYMFITVKFKDIIQSDENMLLNNGNIDIEWVGISKI